MHTILGSTGTIGPLLAEELKKQGLKLRLVSRNPKKLHPDDEIFSADLLNKEQTEEATKGSEVVYLVAGIDYKAKVWEKQWPMLMENVINACKKSNSKLVFFDNMYMYDRDYMEKMTEDTPVNPSSVKGKVRAKINDMIFSEIEKGNLTATIARAPDFMSTNNSVFYEMAIKKLKNGKKATWFLDVDKLHSFIYDVDAARGTAILGTSPQAFEHRIWHLPTPAAKMTIREWIHAVAEELNTESKITVMPMWMINSLGLFMSILKEFKEMTYQYDRDYFFDSSRFNNTFNYKPAKPEEMIKSIVNRSNLINK